MHLLNDEVEPTSLEYNIKARVKHYRKTVTDAGRTYERILVILLPELNDQGAAFMKAWLPDTQLDKPPECIGVMASFGNCRFAVMRAPTEMSDRHYLFVMSKGIEEKILKHRREGDVVWIKILPDTVDLTEGNEVESTDGNYESI